MRVAFFCAPPKSRYHGTPTIIRFGSQQVCCRRLGEEWRRRNCVLYWRWISPPHEIEKDPILRFSADDFLKCTLQLFYVTPRAAYPLLATLFSKWNEWRVFFSFFRIISSSAIPWTFICVYSSFVLAKTNESPSTSSARAALIDATPCRNSFRLFISKSLSIRLFYFVFYQFLCILSSWLRCCLFIRSCIRFIQR